MKAPPRIFRLPPLKREGELPRDARGRPVDAFGEPAPTIHPIPGQCVYCDNRRAVNADAARRRRAKEKTDG